MKLIMVDLDGTLFDTSNVNYMAYKAAIAPYGYEIDYEYYCEYCNGRYYLDFLPQITTEDSNLLFEMHQKKKELYSRYLDYAKVNWRLVDMIKLCREEYQAALVTMASKQNVYDILRYFRLERLFNLVLTRDNIKNPKPDPEGFLMAMQTMDARPDETIIFEDSDVGIRAAELTGATIFCIGRF